MAPSLTPSEPFALEILRARDERQEALLQALNAGHPATLFLSLNIPGREKTPPGAEACFLWVFGRVEAAFPAAVYLSSSFDALGPYRILGLDGDPLSSKRQCIELETGHPSARLIDLDVYTPAGRQVDRSSLGLAARPCLVCDQRAVDCIRIQRHDIGEVIAKVHDLLAQFRA
jgi:holo-ACP synthase CitX